MQDKLEMLTKDLKELLKEGGKLGYKELYKLSKFVEWYVEDGWETESVVTFNKEQNQDFEVVLTELKLLLNEQKVPYIYYSDGDFQYDDYEEHYDPTVSDKSTIAYVPRDSSGYCVTVHQLEAIKHLDAEAFKQEVLRLAHEPFSNYKDLYYLAEEK